MPSPTTEEPGPRRHTHPSPLDPCIRDPSTPWAPEQPESRPSGGLSDIKEQETTTTESSSEQPAGDHVHQGAAHANDEQASPPHQENDEQGPPPPQASNRSIRGRLRARARRIRDKMKRLGENMKEKMAMPAVPHH